MEAEAAVSVLMVAEIAEHFFCLELVEMRFSDVAGDYHAGEKKHGACIVAGPVAVAALEGGEEGDTLVEGGCDAVGG